MKEYGEKENDTHDLHAVISEETFGPRMSLPSYLFFEFGVRCPNFVFNLYLEMTIFGDCKTPLKKVIDVYDRVGRLCCRDGRFTSTRHSGMYTETDTYVMSDRERTFLYTTCVYLVYLK